jgi:hypothetical protein
VSGFLHLGDALELMFLVLLGNLIERLLEDVGDSPSVDRSFLGCKKMQQGGRRRLRVLPELAHGPYPERYPSCPDKF